MLLPVIEVTQDGSQTLRHPVFGDTYHSQRGAIGESRYVFLKEGLKAWLSSCDRQDTPVRILEIGFGSGLNCWLSAEYAHHIQIPVNYTALELYPIPQQVWEALEYAADPLFCALHETRWDAESAVSEWFSLKKIAADLVTTAFDATFDVIYMDAFAPSIQPEMWSEEIFRKLYGCTAPGGVLTTYSAKGSVKRALRDAGYTVDRLPGALGKRHMVRAVKEKA